MTHATKDVVYFDNAATSWPKPPEVQAALMRYLQEVGGSPGRSGHRMSIEASRVVGDAREAVAELFDVEDPARIAFTKNSTEALNIAIFGLLGQGDHMPGNLHQQHGAQLGHAALALPGGAGQH